MVWFLKSTPSRSAARNERVFREAMRRLTREMDAIIGRHAAAGRLQSGATIRVLVQAMHATTAEAIDEALKGIGAVTEHAGRKRQRLLHELNQSLEAHERTAEGTIQFAIERIGLGGDFQHALPLIEQARRRHRERIADFAEGWTAPAGKRWKERHPLLYDALLLLIGAVIGVALQPIANRLLPELGVTVGSSIDRSSSEGSGLARGIQDPRYKRLIEALVAARRTAGISQTELARRLDKRQQFVSKYESGERRLDAVELVDICRALRLNVGRLLQEMSADSNRSS